MFFISEITLKRARYGYIYNKPKPRFAIDQEGILRIVPIPHRTYLWTNMLYRLLSPLYLPYFVQSHLTGLKGIPRESRSPQGKGKGTAVFDSGELERSILNRVRTIALERKHRMTILLSLPEMAKEDFENLCIQMGIGFLKIDLPGDSHTLTIGKNDPHWNSQAQQLIAGQFLSQLAARSHQYKLNSAPSP
jgi:hypothetical protein